MASRDPMVTDADYTSAGKRMARLRGRAVAIAARFDRRRSRIIVSLDSGVELTFPPAMADGLSGARPDDLADVVVTPSGLGLHWPRLDADLYLPALLSGVFGTRSLAAATLGAAGGRTRTPEKARAARNNGKRGGRPRRQAGA